MKVKAFGSEYDMILLHGSGEERAKLLSTLEKGECYERGFPVQDGLVPMHMYVDHLIEGGLEIGKGDAEFGYQMPKPGGRDSIRKLIIFRRR
jgi:hypothetical protein